jgi:hypothetical protein
VIWIGCASIAIGNPAMSRMSGKADVGRAYRFDSGVADGFTGALHAATQMPRPTRGKAHMRASGSNCCAKIRPLGRPIEYIVTLNAYAPRPVNLQCIGKVLRAKLAVREGNAHAPAYEIAATLERYEFVRVQ